jgi:hypothetical protein
MKSLVTEIISALAPDINSLVSRYKKMFTHQFKRGMTDLELMVAEFTIIGDMARSIEKYTADGDILISVESSVSAKMNLEIVAMVERDGVQYRMDTEVITAGGYNIQCLHYRYITDSKLPKRGNDSVSKEYATKIKNINTVIRIEEEMDSAIKVIERYQSFIVNEKMPTLQLIDCTTTWHDSKEECDAYQEKRLTEDIEAYHYNLKHYKSIIKNCQKQMIKLQEKLENLKK